MIDLDIETRATLNVVEYGLYRHAPTAKILLMWYRIDEGPWTEWRGYFADGETPDCSDEPPQDFLDALKAGKPLRAWNAAYERVVLSAQPWCPTIPPEQTICLAAWAATFNLPRSLHGASMRLLPTDQRKKVALSKGVAYMWDATQPMTSAPDMDIQSEYCHDDCVAMMEIAKLLPAPTKAWLKEYHAAERVNDLGVLLDEDLAEAIVSMKPAIDAALLAEIREVAAGAEIKLRGPSLLRWLEQNLPEHLQKELIIDQKYRDGLGFKTRKWRSAGKAARAQLLAALEHEEGADQIRRLLQAFEEANKAAVGKFAAARTRVSNDGALRGQFVFRGAGQTGRFSSTGVQVHNLKRDVADDVGYTVDTILTHHRNPQVVADKLGMTVNKAASEVLRPMFVPDEGRLMYWCDWSAIEARMLPWLSGDKRAEHVLDIFRRDGDIYKTEATGIFSKPENEIDKDERQIGKVAVLSLGYQGGVGAFQSMASNYGVQMTDQQANDIKNAWRSNNPWAVDFWSKLENAAMDAVRQPGQQIDAGRVTYQFLPTLLRGTLLCWLPSGHWIAYPEAQIVDVPKFDGAVIEPALVFMHPAYGLSTTYGGALAENVTQAESASLLRDALVRAIDANLEIVAHVHDEIIGECDLGEPDPQTLQDIMNDVPEWAEGLPLASEVETGWRYKVANP